MVARFEPVALAASGDEDTIKEAPGCARGATLGLREALYWRMIFGMSNKVVIRLASGLATFAVAAAVIGLAGTAGPAWQAALRPSGVVSVALAAGDTNFNITGVVQGVSYDQNVIEVLAAGVKQSIHVTPTTSIAKHGETGSISDIRPGAHVVVTGVVQNGQHVAVTIEIK